VRGRFSSKAVEWIYDHCREANSIKDFILAGYEERLEPATKKSTKDGVITKTEVMGWRSFSAVGKSSLEALTLAGAMDVFDHDHSTVMAMIPTIQELSAKYHEQVCKVKNCKRVKAGHLPEDIKALIDA
jgi:hypothetical protein